MAFVCKFQLNNGSIATTDTVIFVEFIDSSFGSFHSNPVKIAKVVFNERPAFIYSTCPSFPSTKEKLIKGQLLNSDTTIGYFAAEGEDIPYNKPYAIIKFE
jgi:hypothetical protein